MSSYCLNVKSTENINPRISKTSIYMLLVVFSMLLSKCLICVGKNSRFIKKQEANGILSGLGLRTPWWFHVLNSIKNMNEIINKIF